MPARTAPSPARRLVLLLALVLCAGLPPDPAAAGPLRDRIAERQAGSETQRLTVDGRERGYEFFVPALARPGAPLVIVLHGTYGTGEKMQRGLGFDAQARQHGFLVAYPDAYVAPGARQTERWNDGRGTLPSSATGIDDVAFIAALIDDVARRFPIDPRRVFVTGTSNGGMMTYRLGCELPGRIRAIAPEIGAMPTPIAGTCRPAPGLSVLAINGSLDPFVPLAGGTVCVGVPCRYCEGGEVLSPAASLARFAAANGCAARPVTRTRPPAVDDGTQVEERRYPGCRAGTEVRGLVVQGMGHVWPPRQGQLPSAGPGSGNLDATAEITAFFLAQR